MYYASNCSYFLFFLHTCVQYFGNVYILQMTWVTILILCTSNNCSLALLLYVSYSSVHKNRKHYYGTLKNRSKSKQMFKKWKQIMEIDAFLIKCYFMVGAGTWNIWVLGGFDKNVQKLTYLCWMENKRSGDA